jgi:hypothetical protein
LAHAFAPTDGDALYVPVDGVTTFELFRPFRGEQIEVIFPNGKTYELDLFDLKLWLRRIGCMQVDKLVDVVWNFPRVRYDLLQQHLVVPDSQLHPDDEPTDERDNDLPSSMRVEAARRTNR